MKIFLTGITGFVGRATALHLIQGGHQVLAAVRRSGVSGVQGAKEEIFNDLASHDWVVPLAEQEIVIHCAGRVHVMKEHSQDALTEFRRVNVEGTLHLARSAVKAGVKRFIFISSVKVNGEGTELGHPYSADQSVCPQDPYGISKWEAEQQLTALAQQTGLQVTIIRPVLVYGPGVKANFLSMMRWLQKGLPLPFGAIRNKRSMVALDNLVDLIVRCMVHPAASNQVFMISDGEDLSTTELLARTGAALGTRVRLWPIPSWMLVSVARGIGKRAFAQRLCGSLQVDIEKTRLLLDWEPPVSVDQALGKTARYFLERRE